MINITMFQAENGDAFLLKFDNGQNILIDMGMPNTYNNEIKKDLISLKAQGQKIDLLIITHIDQDHIGGAIEFLEDNKKNEIIEVSEIWYNSYMHLQFDKEKVDKISEDETSILQTVISQNQTSIISDGVKKISCKQGSSFASLLYKYNYKWNSSFSNKAICIENKTELILGELKFIFLSPNQEKLKKLAKKWLKELSKKKYDFSISDEEIFDDAYEFFMKYEAVDDISVSHISSKNNNDFEKLSEIEEEDGSQSNGSSLAFIIEYKNKKLLFLGDAHKDIVCESLKKLKDEEYELLFDIVKISHHGSNKNISKDLVSLIDSDKYLFSTDGKSHNHPDLTAISKIILRNTTSTKQLIFNYDLELSEKLDKEDLKSKYNYEVKNQSEIELI